LDISTFIFDICSTDPLPVSDVLAAADVLYFKETGRALARRCVEALSNGTYTL